MHDCSTMLQSYGNNINGTGCLAISENSSSSGPVCFSTWLEASKTLSGSQKQPTSSFKMTSSFSVWYLPSRRLRPIRYRWGVSDRWGQRVFPNNSNPRVHTGRAGTHCAPRATKYSEVPLLYMVRSGSKQPLGPWHCWTRREPLCGWDGSAAVRCGRGRAEPGSSKHAMRERERERQCERRGARGTRPGTELQFCLLKGLLASADWKPFPFPVAQCLALQAQKSRLFLSCLSSSRIADGYECRAKLA